jgi:hypothetical protein
MEPETLEFNWAGRSFVLTAHDAGGVLGWYATPEEVLDDGARVPAADVGERVGTDRPSAQHALAFGCWDVICTVDGGTMPAMSR